MISRIVLGLFLAVLTVALTIGLYPFPSSSVYIDLDSGELVVRSTNVIGVSSDEIAPFNWPCDFPSCWSAPIGERRLELVRGSRWGSTSLRSTRTGVAGSLWFALDSLRSDLVYWVEDPDNRPAPQTIGSVCSAANAMIDELVAQYREGQQMSFTVPPASPSDWPAWLAQRSQSP